MPGTAWTLGAIGVTGWPGVPLVDGARARGHHVVGGRRDATSGSTTPYVADGIDHGRVRRPLPVGKALDDALLAYEMDGEELPPDHGYPVRLVVPGWIGIASVKWVGSIEVSTCRLWSPWNTKWYPKSFSEQVTKSAFELPWGAPVPLGRRRTLHGRSWSPRGPIRRVDVSTDGGASWHRAHLHGPNRPSGWARWTLPWTPRRRGRTELLARATDAAGRRQPDRVPFNADGYMFWAVARHPVEVSASAGPRRSRTASRSRSAPRPARNSTASATSSGSIHGTGSRLPAERSAISCGVMPSSAARPSFIGVLTPVGWIDTTRMPCGASSIAHDLVRPIRPHCDAA